MFEMGIMGWVIGAVLLAGLGLFVYSKINHPGYEKIEDEAKRLRDKAVSQWPALEMKLRTEIQELKAKIAELLAEAK